MTCSELPSFEIPCVVSCVGVSSLIHNFSPRPRRSSMPFGGVSIVHMLWNVLLSSFEMGVLLMQSVMFLNEDVVGSAYVSRFSPSFIKFCVHELRYFYIGFRVEMFCHRID